MTTETGSPYFRSRDGLNLFFRDTARPGVRNDGTPIICLPGLTRNSRDFEDLALYLSDRRRVISLDFRGRGFSDYDRNWRHYHALTYVADVWQLLDLLKIDRVIVIGTSLGGLCAMVMAAQHGDRIAGVILNDIGPAINPAGIARIQDYTGRLAPVSNWAEAEQQTRTVYGEWLPGLNDDDFARITRRGFREIESAVPRLDMDANIGRAVREIGAVKGDPWEFFAALERIPATLVWGVLSDVLTKDIVEKMKAKKPDLDVVPVPDRGHVPLLDESECISAIDAFLQKVA